MDELTRIEIDNLKERILRIEKIQENYDAELKELRQLLNEFDTTQQLILQKLDTIMSSIEQLQKDTISLKEKPATKWENAKWLVVGGVITAIVTFIISKILGG